MTVHAIPQTDWNVPARLAAELAHADIADGLPYSRRATAAATVATTLERDATYVGFAYDVVPEIVSKRLGCKIHHPVYAGLDLTALCVHGP